MKVQKLKIAAKMRYKVLLLASVYMSAIMLVDGQTYTESRTFKRAFGADKNTSLDIGNKYGTIQIINGKSDSLSVRAEVSVTSSDAKRTTKLLNDVTVNIIETGSIIRANSDFGSNPGFLIESFKNVTGKIISYDNRLEVNYYITVPEGISMKINNIYGDVYLEDVAGSLSITLSNGSLQTGYLAKATSIDLSFVNGSVKGINSGRISASYSDIKIGDSGSLEITSKSSKLEIDSCSGIKLNSRRDRVYIESVKELTADTYFSDVTAESVSDEINLKSNYGSVRITKLDKSFSLVSVTSQFTDIYFGLESDINTGVDIKTTSTKLSVSEVDENLKEKGISDGSDELVTYGYIGRDNSNSRIEIEALRGTLSMKYK